MRSDELPETIGTPLGPSVEGASGALLSELLFALEVALKEQGVPTERFLRPGIAAADVRAVFAANQLVAPDEAVSWFGWHDGPTRSEKGSDLVMPMFMLWSLGEVNMMRNAPRSQRRGAEPWQWNPSWIQIMGDANGLAIHCDNEPSKTPLVRGLTWGENATQAELPLSQVVSLCTPVTWWIDALRRGWYRWSDADQAWDVDHSQQPTIRAIHSLS